MIRRRHKKKKEKVAWVDFDPVVEQLLRSRREQAPKAAPTKEIINGYELGTRLGAGTFGEVFIGTKLGMEFAVKRMNFEIVEGEDSESTHPYKLGVPRDQLTEAVLLATLKHPNIVPSLDTFFQSDSYGQLHLYIVMPLAAGSLGKWTRRFWAVATEKDILPRVQFLFRQLSHDVFAALAHLQVHRVPHCDIKPDNFLIFYAPGTAGRRLTELKLADFGSANLPDAESRVPCGTRMYEAPEIRNHKRSESLTAGDIWGAGLLLLELFFGLDASEIRDRGSKETTKNRRLPLLRTTKRRHRPRNSNTCGVPSIPVCKR